MEVSNHCPKLLTRALLPEAAMEHALRAVQTENRVRRWKLNPDSEWELLYSCARGQVDWNSPDGKMPYVTLLICPIARAVRLPCVIPCTCCWVWHVAGCQQLLRSCKMLNGRHATTIVPQMIHALAVSSLKLCSCWLAGQDTDLYPFLLLLQTVTLEGAASNGHSA